MNVRTGLKTLAVALPMAVAPMKSAAQTVAKEIKDPAVIEQMLKRAESEKTVITKEPLIIYGKAGAGYGLDPFFSRGVAEAKGNLSLGIRNEGLKAQFDASLGKTTQNYGVKVGGMFKTGNPQVGLEAGTVFRHQQVNSGDVKGVFLKGDVDALKPGDCGVENYRAKNFWGAYVSPSYKFGKAEVNANVEAGLAGLGGVKKSGNVNVAEIQGAIDEGRMVDRSATTAAANFGLGAKYEVAKGLKLGADVNYSTFDKHAGFNVGATYEFGKNIRK